MSFLFLILIMVIGIIIFSALISKNKKSIGTINFPYLPEAALFSVAERSFLGVLELAVGPEFRVFGKVRVADLAKVKPGLSKSARQGALNRIAAKHVDFVVCRVSDLSVICVVELNDRSHATQRAQARDELLANVCKAINLPFVQRW